jgi:hypothetical protein
MTASYSIRPQAPTGVTTVTPENLHDGEGWYLTLQAQGVAVVHEVWTREDGTCAAYLIRPETGPSTGVTRWAQTEREVSAWNLIDDDAGDNKYGVTRFVQQVAAELWVLQQAHLETAAEMGWEL